MTLHKTISHTWNPAVLIRSFRTSSWVDQLHYFTVIAIHGLIYRPLPSTGRLSGGSGALCFSASAQESAEEPEGSVRLKVRRTPLRCYSIRQRSRPHELPTDFIHKRATSHQKMDKNKRTRFKHNVSNTTRSNRPWAFNTRHDHAKNTTSLQRTYELVKLRRADR